MQSALHSISNGLYVIGAGLKPNFGGALVDAVTQISATPPLIMLSMMNTSHTLSIIIKNNEENFELSVNGNKETIELMLGMLFINLLNSEFTKEDILILVEASEIIRKNKKPNVIEILNKIRKEEK